MEKLNKKTATGDVENHVVNMAMRYLRLKKRLNGGHGMGKMEESLKMMQLMNLFN